MNKLFTIACLSALFSASCLGQTIPRDQNATAAANPRPLDQEVPHYELTDGGLIDGLSELSRNQSVQLHLGIEEILRERLQSPRDRSIKFSIVLEHKSVREVLDALCGYDSRYTWSMDGSSINVYPFARANDQTDLLNFQIERIHITDIPDPDQALTPLSKIFPGEQIGYMQLGGDNTYDVPWTVTFGHLTVRQLMNRVTEHIGPRSSWTWQGGKDGRVFSFSREGFHSRNSQ